MRSTRRSSRRECPKPIDSKRKTLEDLMARLVKACPDAEKVMVVFKETTWENWAFAGGRLVHA